jgi:transcriptional regulator of acetoin/glycerol metabolism
MTRTSPLLAPSSAWEKFVLNGELDSARLRPEIAQAWRRCRAANLDPFAGRCARQLDPGELALLLEKRKDLIEVARPFMAKLYQFVADSLFVVLLCDERGYLLETMGDPEAIANSRDLNFNPGAAWTEEEVGNNGVGTSLHLRAPFQVSGEEHFCRKHHPWTCSGAPIVDEEDRMIGILEMSGPVQATNQHTLGMVVAAAEAIQQQLRVQARNRELMLLNNHLNSLFLSVSDGVVVIDALGIVRQVNPVAEKIFSTKAERIVGTHFSQHWDKVDPIRDLLDLGKPFNDLEFHLGAGAMPVSSLASGKPIKDQQGRITSAVVFLNPLHRINNLINRFSGAQATFTFEDILGIGEALVKSIRIGVHASKGDSTVLLTGESGTGKEMFAQAIHNRGARRNGPFIALNCGAIPRELIGSELFGYVEGAFTGAQKRGRPGKFELAAGGTLFLDEIGDMPLEQQVSLLRVLQDKSVTRIGGDKNLHVDVRIICATNRDLTLAIAKGNFRQDLYYRLNVISIQLPPLRAHREDIPMLFKTFYESTCRKLGVEAAPVDPAVIRRLQQYHWPGNVREFQNVVERMVHCLGQPALDLGDLPEEVLDREAQGAPPPAGPAAELETLHEHRAQIRASLINQECRKILELITAHNGNVSRTARDMGVSRSYLYRKLASLHPRSALASEHS